MLIESAHSGGHAPGGVNKLLAVHVPLIDNDDLMKNNTRERVVGREPIRKSGNSAGPRVAVILRLTVISISCGFPRSGGTSFETRPII
jgi:hypothetical protein